MLAKHVTLVALVALGQAVVLKCPYQQVVIILLLRRQIECVEHVDGFLTRDVQEDGGLLFFAARLHGFPCS